MREDVAFVELALAELPDTVLDLTDPGLWDRLRAEPPRIDRAGVRAEATAALEALLDAYEKGPEPVRQQVRDIFRQHPRRASALATWASTSSQAANLRPPRDHHPTAPTDPGQHPTTHARVRPAPEHPAPNWAGTDLPRPNRAGPQPATRDQGLVRTDYAGRNLSSGRQLIMLRCVARH